MRPIGYDRPPPGGRNTPCLSMRRGCASRRRSSWREVRALLVHRAGAVGCVVAAVRLDHAYLVVRGLRPYLLRKDSGLVRLARQTGGRGEGRNRHCPPYLPTPWTSPPLSRSPPSHAGRTA